MPAHRTLACFKLLAWHVTVVCWQCACLEGKAQSIAEPAGPFQPSSGNSLLWIGVAGGGGPAGRLAAVAVLDVLPRCLSSVYFFWDPSLAPLALGKLSALREVAWVADAARARPALHWYYMGFYIHACPKVRASSGGCHRQCRARLQPMLETSGLMRLCTSTQPCIAAKRAAVVTSTPDPAVP